MRKTERKPQFSVHFVHFLRVFALQGPKGAEKGRKVSGFGIFFQNTEKTVLNPLIYETRKCDQLTAREGFASVREGFSLKD